MPDQGSSTNIYCYPDFLTWAKRDRQEDSLKGQVAQEIATLHLLCLAVSLQNGEADAMSLDGGHAYIAGQCGLVPVMAENYGE